MELNDDLRGEFNAAYEDLGRRGERVIGFADLQLDQKKYPKGGRLARYDQVASGQRPAASGQ